jgi:hypothetical protein
MTMTKSELKTGMVLTNRTGERFMFHNNCVYSNSGKFLYHTNILVSENGTWSMFEKYNEDLTHNMYSSMDVIKVEVLRHAKDIWCAYTPENYVTIWERPTPKKMTVSEIESILGYKIEIIAEKEN